MTDPSTEPDPEASAGPPDWLDEARRRQTRSWWRVLGLTAVIVVVLIVVLLGLISSLDPDEKTSTFWVAAGPILLILVVMAAMIAFSFWGRRRGIGWLQPTIGMSAGKAARKRAVHAVRSGQHLTGRDEEIALSFARALRRSVLIYPWLLAVFILNLVVTILNSHWWFTAEFAILIPLTFMLWLRRKRQTSRYLASTEPARTHPRSAGDAGAV